MPVGTPYNGGQSPLEVAAIAARKILIPKNIYNDYVVKNEYNATHTRAVSDITTPIYGKGSGKFLDITNYFGVGGDWDINGTPANIGSGRRQAIVLNGGLWGYGPVPLSLTEYTSPNTKLNIGQVII